MSSKQTILVPLANEEGSALVLALILMAVLTLIGLSTINTTTTEFKIVRNERIYLDNFYKAESAVRESIQDLEGTSSDDLADRDFPLDWLKQYDEDVDMSDTDVWDSTNSEVSSVDDADFAVVEKGVAQLESLDMSATSSLYDYEARGWGHANGGNVVIKVGYKKRH
jgi:Tfp pilus assembly protein PilX